MTRYHGSVPYDRAKLAALMAWVAGFIAGIMITAAVVFLWIL